MNINTSITQLIGKTPLLQLTNYNKQNNLGADVIVKLEYFNVNQSVKDRIALNMIEEAEKSGALKPGYTIVEITSGNTGIGLAAIAAAKGYKFRTYIQDQVSKERTQVIRAFGGEVVKLSEVPSVTKIMEEVGGDFVGIVNALKEHEFKNSKDIFFADQVSNLANREAHIKTTGPEIWEDTNEDVDVFVSCVGTGGSVSGVGKYLKSKNPNIHVVAIQPAAESIASEENPDVEEITGVHPFEGIPEEWIPGNFDKTVYDERFDVSTEQAFEAARAVAKSDGILIGTSSGAGIYAATQIAKRAEYKGKKIVVLLADTGLRYLSTPLFEA